VPASAEAEMMNGNTSQTFHDFCTHLSGQRSHDRVRET